MIAYFSLRNQSGRLRTAYIEISVDHQNFADLYIGYVHEDGSRSVGRPLEYLTSSPDEILSELRQAIESLEKQLPPRPSTSDVPATSAPRP